MEYLIILIIVAAVILRSIPESINSGSDETDYLLLATSLLNGKYEVPGTGLDTSRTPGYPFFVAACGASWRNVRMVQNVLSAGTVFIIYRITLPFGLVPALAAAILLTAEPDHIKYAGSLLPDTLLSFLYLLGVYLLILDVPLLSALILGVSVLVKPVNVCIVVIPLGWSLNLWALPVFIAPFLPWMIRNYMKYGYFSISSLGGYNALYYNVAFSVMWWNKMDIRDVYAGIGKIERERQDFTHVAGQISMVRHYIKSHPGRYVMGQFKGIWKMFWTDDYWHMLMLALSYGSALAGMVCMIANGVYTYPLLIAGTAVYYAVMSGAAGRPRYKLPISALYMIPIAYLLAIVIY